MEHPSDTTQSPPPRTSSGVWVPADQLFAYMDRHQDSYAELSACMRKTTEELVRVQHTLGDTRAAFSELSHTITHVLDSETLAQKVADAVRDALTAEEFLDRIAQRQVEAVARWTTELGRRSLVRWLAISLGMGGAAYSIQDLVTRIFG